jgi:PAS domain S-box-containing protein
MAKRVAKEPLDSAYGAQKSRVIKVLHVDDDPAILEVSKLILMDMGNFEINHACCVDEAFKKLKTELYDVVISDYEMPNKTGLDFLKEIRDQENDIPFILFTGKGREEVVIKALNLGADGYINKQGNTEMVYRELSHTINQIVQHRKAKNELQQRDILLAEFASQTPGMLFQFRRRPDGTYCMPYAAEAISDIFGCSPQDVLEDFSPIAKAIIPEDLEKVIRSIEDSAKNMTPWQFEYRIQLPGQQIRWLWGQSIPTKLSDGTITWSGYNADITERKQTEEMLKQSLGKFRDFAESLPEIVFEIDDKGNIVFVNQRASQITGYRVDEFGDNFSFIRLVAPADQGKAATHIKRILSGEIVGSSEYDLIKKDGAFLPVMVWATPFIIQNKVAGLRGIIVDISQRKQAEEALRQERDMLESLTRNIGAGLVMISKDYKILWMNDYLKQIGGATENNHCYSSFNNCTTICPDCGVKKIFDGVSLDRREYCNQTEFHKDHPLWFELIATPIKDKEGKVIAALELTVNITEKKEAEKKLKEASDRIEVMNEKLRVMGGLTRHDVRNKLFIVTGNTFLLKKKYADQADIVDALNTIEQAIKEVVKIFDFAKIYEELGVEEQSYIDVGKAIDEATAQFPELTVKVVNNCQGLKVFADSLLKQLFFNLIDNTRKYGKITTTIKMSYEKMDNDEVRLIYEDDGVGISSENKSKLFTEGFSTGGSTGFGLFLIKKMIEVYGWTIKETGETGKGAKFVITIPKVNMEKRNFK